MVNNKNQSLRAQIIEAMKDYGIDVSPCSPEMLFDVAIMPVLQRAMEAGELLVSRNTRPRITMPEAAKKWIAGMVGFAEDVRQEEAIISKRQLLSIIYNLGESAARAMADIESA